MIEKMTKYSFILLSGKNEEFLKELQKLGLVDVTRSSKPVDEKSSAMLFLEQELQTALQGIGGVDWSKDPMKNLIEAEAAALPESDSPLTLWKEESSKLAALQAELEQAHKDAEDARVWGSYDAKSLEAITAKGYRIRFYKVPKKKYDPSWELLYPLQEVADNGKTVWFVTVSDDSGYSLPVDECAAPTGDIDSVLGRIDLTQKRIISCKAALLALKGQAGELRNTRDKVSSDLQLYLADKGAGKAAEDHITTFIGFAPSANERELCEEFDKLDVIYVKEDAVRDDDPPIKFKENKIVKMFTVLTDMYGRPSYNEFDPTPYISIFFTLFFAMCMGDAGYGLMLLILGIGMKKKLGNLAPLVTFLGGATFFMGIILHTFFGIDLSTAAWVPDWMKSCMIKGEIAGFDAQMLFSVLIGIVHLSIAMLLKAVYSVKKKGFVNSLGTLGWTLLLVGGVIVGGFSLLGVIGSEVTKWIVIALGAVSAVGIFILNDVHRNPLINIGSGLYETYNTVTGLLGDVLSYLRLYALGLAGGMLGSAFNDLGTSILGSGIPGLDIFLCALILILGHVLNLAMCCLGAFVHPLRLNFLEFFKNSGYEGEGKVYSPLTDEASENIQ